MAYISKNAEDNLVKILEWSKQEDINALICADKNILALFTNLEVDLIRLKRTRQRDNLKTWQAIKERRKIDKNYCRTHK